MKMNRRDSNLPANQNKKSEQNLANSKLANSTKEEIRLQAYLAHCGVASRRASEQIILDGRVKVNGQLVTTLGTKVSDKDLVTVDDKKIQLEAKKRYVLLNKPAGFVCSASDEKGRAVAADLLKEKYSERLYNVGRLDMYSKGMIIFTNDGEFAAKLSHPSSQLEKEYIVETSQDVPEDFPARFEKGIRVDGTFYKCLRCQILKSRKIKIVLIEGKNREIRTVLESQNIGTKSLVRVRIGNVNLDDLKPGDSRDLSDIEVKGLLKLCK
ncbi:MAG: rRNA pseudouridine synthase [Treponema sp.]|nr:rRNA pseudouridine synthase [Treponema sp.]